MADVTSKTATSSSRSALRANIRFAGGPFAGCLPFVERTIHGLPNRDLVSAQDALDTVKDGETAEYRLVFRMLEAKNLKVIVTLPDGTKQEFFIPREWSAEQVLLVYAPPDAYQYELVDVSEGADVVLLPTDFLTHSKALEGHIACFEIRRIPNRAPVETQDQCDAEGAENAYVSRNCLDSMNDEASAEEQLKAETISGGKAAIDVAYNGAPAQAPSGSEEAKTAASEGARRRGSRQVAASEDVEDVVVKSTAAFRNVAAQAAKDEETQHMRDLITSGPTPPERTAPDNVSLTSFALHSTIRIESFGRVRVAMRKDKKACQCEIKMGDGRAGPVALKFVRKELVVSSDQVSRVIQEKRILQAIDHPFIIRLYYTFQDEKRLLLVTDFPNGGELYTYIRQNGGLLVDAAKFYAAEVCTALIYLHNLNIIFRNLKPENVLLTQQGHVKLSDFGFAKLISQRTWTICGTPQYLAPEIITNSGHGKSADWWAMGILNYEMLAGFPPFDHRNLMTLYEMIADPKTKPIFPKGLQRRAKDFTKSLLTYNPGRRLGNRESPEEVLRHVWLKIFDWGELTALAVHPPRIPKAGNPLDTSMYDPYPESAEDSAEVVGDNADFAGF
eukprot:GEMP01008755.1.p1 GENE.GEMP01008755.1~~GEMP01008755.1.p1  ORF type:complete len:616 (+),score=145.80 GEMP01008755.1:98-1945(+)